MNVITERERNRTLEQEYSAGNFSKSIVNNKKEIYKRYITSTK